MKKTIVSGVIATALLAGAAAPAFADSGIQAAQQMTEEQKDLKTQQIIVALRTAQEQLKQANKELSDAQSIAEYAAFANAGLKGSEWAFALMGAKDAAFAVMAKDKPALSKALTKVIIGASAYVGHKAYLDDAVERRSTVSETEAKKRRDELKTKIDDLQRDLAAALVEAKK
ncbi:hypothetical protein [Bdellovibrio sp. HCB2-146]|uniref:hypothetical protein n=1 Tax=Bdellovibrio sp. HCB2-146 TaxID=3394362 RepID=UPI0039BD8AE3